MSDFRTAPMKFFRIDNDVYVLSEILGVTTYSTGVKVMFKNGEGTDLHWNTNLAYIGAAKEEALKNDREAATKYGKAISDALVEYLMYGAH